MHYRAVFLSDIHLGSPDCQAERLLDFLRDVTCDHLYLVGDIFDFWSLRRVWFWEQSHNDVIQKFLRKSRKGTRIVYIPGNHDDVVREFGPLQLAGIEVAAQAVHTTATGGRLLVLHGDEFDGILAQFFHPIGPISYRLVRGLWQLIKIVRRRLGHPEWSLAAMLAHAENLAVGTRSKFRELATHEALSRGFDGVVCGHIHWPVLDVGDRFLYANSGDWVDNCSAIVEHVDGQWALLRG